MFVGDSITHLWGGAPKPNRLLRRRRLGALLLAPERRQPADSDGIARNRPSGVWTTASSRRQTQGAVVLIGTNNLKPHNARENSNEEIVAGIRAVCDRIRAKSPATRILLLGLFPRGQDPADLRPRPHPRHQRRASEVGRSRRHHLPGRGAQPAGRRRPVPARRGSGFPAPQPGRLPALG